MYDICVIGLGYVGLPLCAIWSNKFRVLGHDINTERINNLKKLSDIHEEKDVEKLVKKNFLEGNLFFSTEIKKASNYIISVPTPVTNHRSVDLSYVFKAIEKIGKVMINKSNVVIESTCSPGTHALIEKKFIKDNKWNFDLFMAPERVLPGNTIHELKTNSRIIGGSKKRFSEIKDLYENLTTGKINFCTAHEAELSKLFENTFRDVNIALANEMEEISNTYKANFNKIKEMANQHPRVNIHLPGIGVGGHCIPVDPHFLIQGNNVPLISTAREVNDKKPHKIANIIGEKVIELKIKELDIYGMSYKPGVSDFRESPSLIISEILQKKFNIKTNLFDLKNDQNLKIRKKTKINDKKKHIILVKHNEYLNKTKNCVFSV